MARCLLHSHGRRFLLLLVTGLWLGACAQKQSIESVMPSESLSRTCSENTIPNQYVVYWKDGRISQVRATSRENLKEDIVRPALDSIRKVEHDILFKLSASEIGPQKTLALPSNNNPDNWSHANAQTESAWQANIKGQGVIVAVIDSGADINHPLLANQIYVNPGESGSKANNGIDDDGNGYVDDVRGYDFLDDDNTVNDEIGHGTHVSGTIAAEHNENHFTQNVLLSVAPQAKIMPLKFLGNFGGSLGAALKAMDYAGRNGAKIINASWGGNGCSQILQDKIIELGQKGILFVAASGNSGNNLDFAPEFPAAFTAPEQITVGSITPFNGMSNFSNYSKTLVHIFAPGSEIASTYPDNDIQMLSGTSMATPFVAGAAALVASVHPNYTPQQIKNLILSSVVKDSFYSNATQGRINIKKLVDQL